MTTDLPRKVASALRWVAITRLSGQLLQWCVTLLVVRILSPEDYGLMAMAGVLIGLATLLNELGLVPALIQSKEASADLVGRVFGFVLLSNLLLFGTVFVLAPSLAAFFENPALTWVMRALGLQLIIGAFGAVPMALLRRRLEFRGISLLSLGANASASLVSLTLALMGYGVWALVGATLITVTIETLGVIYLAQFRVKPELGVRGMRRFFSYGAWVSGSRIAWHLGHSADDIIIGKALGDGALGFYSVARHLSTMPMDKVLSVLNQVAFPAYSRLEGNVGRGRDYFLKSIRLASLLFFSTMWGLSSVADEFVVVVLGEKWLEVSIVLKLLSLTVPFRAVAYLLNPLLNALGRPDIGFRNVTTLVVLAPASILVGVSWGIVGVAIALAVTYPLVVALNMSRSLALLECRWSELLRAMGGAFSSACVMYASVYIGSYLTANLPPWSKLGTGVLIGVSVFGLMTLLVNREAITLFSRVVTTSRDKSND